MAILDGRGDYWAAAFLGFLALWILLSGLDDFFICLVFLKNRRKPFPWPTEAELARAPKRRIAIFVPVWREHAVIGRMLDRNLSAIQYPNYDIFVGAYPNDPLTIGAVEEVARRNSQVHLVVGAKNGPTSKGDCLNTIYQAMLRYEARRQIRFEAVLTHDAEDLVHPESLRLVDWFAQKYEMVQVPVLPLPTSLREFTHGVYCDEFAEYQFKDIPARQSLRSFLPSNGVGTGFTRAATERLAKVRDGRVFDPECLTEDYENGLRLHLLGARQIFLPIRFAATGPVATREYFPRALRAAVRQRTRWVIGIALQGWQRNGWRGPLRLIYWFWRDRKGLVGNLVSPLASMLFVAGAAGYGASLLLHRLWTFGGSLPAWFPWIYLPTTLLSMAQIGVRMDCCARIYGWRFAALAPLRVLWANTINCAATTLALWQFLLAGAARRTLVWTKTEHVHLGHTADDTVRLRLGEVLVRIGCISMGDLDEALSSAPKGVRLGEYLFQANKIREEDLYRALSIHHGIPLGRPAESEINRAVARTFPATVARRCKAVPFRVAAGHLHVATTDLPSGESARELARHSALALQFRLVLPKDFEELAGEYLPRG